MEAIGTLRIDILKTLRQASRNDPQPTEPLVLHCWLLHWHYCLPCCAAAECWPLGANALPVAQLAQFATGCWLAALLVFGYLLC